MTEALHAQLREVFVSPKPWMHDRTALPTVAMVNALIETQAVQELLADQGDLALATQFEIPVPGDKHHPIIVARSHRHQVDGHWGIADRVDLARAHFWTVKDGWRGIRYLRHDDAHLWPRTGAIRIAQDLANTGQTSRQRETF